MNRTEHLNWCKNRALEYVDNGDLTGALASFTSDMSKHSETKDHIALRMGLQLAIIGALDTPEKMKSHITGFN